MTSPAAVISKSFNRDLLVESRQGVIFPERIESIFDAPARFLPPNCSAKLSLLLPTMYFSSCP